MAYNIKIYMTDGTTTTLSDSLTSKGDALGYFRSIMRNGFEYVENDVTIFIPSYSIKKGELVTK